MRFHPQQAGGSGTKLATLRSDSGRINGGSRMVSSRVPPLRRRCWASKVSRSRCCLSSDRCSAALSGCSCVSAAPSSAGRDRSGRLDRQLPALARPLAAVLSRSGHRWTPASGAGRDWAAIDQQAMGSGAQRPTPLQLVQLRQPGVRRGRSITLTGRPPLPPPWSSQHLSRASSEIGQHCLLALKTPMRQPATSLEHLEPIRRELQRLGEARAQTRPAGRTT